MIGHQQRSPSRSSRQAGSGSAGHDVEQDRNGETQADLLELDPIDEHEADEIEIMMTARSIDAACDVSADGVLDLRYPAEGLGQELGAQAVQRGERLGELS